MDLKVPTFSDPLNITNPLFPQGPGKLSQTIETGGVGPIPVRSESTPINGFHAIRWDGKKVKTAITHSISYQNRRVVETVYHYYAQADDGSVWSFGQTVTNYKNGVATDHDGSWRAGRNGPPAMVMPADPKVGDIFFPENIPGVAFEEATVTAVGRTVRGPRGDVAGAVDVKVELMDGRVEEKIYAPGYGELRAEARWAQELSNTALAVPTDNLSGPIPGELTGMIRATYRNFLDTGRGSWVRAGATTARMAKWWETYETTTHVPRQIEVQMDLALSNMEKTIVARDSVGARQAAIDIAQATFDLHLRYRGQDAVDTARLGAWSRQQQLDKAVGDAGAAAGDQVVIDFIKARM